MAKYVCQIWLGLVFSVFAIVLFGLEMSFNVYAVDLKQTFNFTQTEVELVSVSGMVGVGFGVIEPFIFDRVGYKIGYFIIWFIISGSAFLMWLAVIYKDTFRHWLIISTIQFFMSAGENFGTMRVTATLVNNFPERHSAKIVGLCTGVIAISKLFYGVLLQVILVNDLQCFFLVTAAAQALIVGSTFIIHAVHNDKVAIETEYDTLNERETIMNKSVPDAAKYSFSTMLQSSYFHGTFWPSVITYSIVFTMMSNITSIAKSLSMDQGMNLVYVISLTIVIGRISSGVAFDKLKKTKLSAFVFLLAASLAAELGLVLLVLRPTSETLYWVALALGIGVSLALSITASRLATVFGQQNLPYIVGCFLCFMSFFFLIFQLLIGMLYDLSLTDDGFCYGSTCFFLSYVIFLILIGVSVCLHIVNYIIHAWE